jgi:Phage terminase, small subunit
MTPRPPTPRRLKPSGRALWRHVVEDVPEGMILDAIELEVLRMACQTVDTAADLEREARAMPTLVAGSGEQLVVNPLLREARLHRSAAVTMLAKIKLSPPEQTGHLSKRQRDRRRDQLAAARRARWPAADA